MSRKIILASQSPRRKQLLEWAEIDFEIMVSNSDESYPDHLNPAEVAVYIAKNKALAIKEKAQSAFPIVAADTIVVCDNEIIGKPKDAAEAINTIKKLSGKTHQVITGVCLINDQYERSFSDVTEVSFHELTDEQIRFYVEKYQPFDKAGAYAIQ